MMAMAHVYANPPWQVSTSIEQTILAKLAEYGVSLDASDDDLHSVFANTVAPTKCFRIAKELQARTAMIGG